MAVQVYWIAGLCKAVFKVVAHSHSKPRRRDSERFLKTTSFVRRTFINQFLVVQSPMLKLDLPRGSTEID